MKTFCLNLLVLFILSSCNPDTQNKFYFNSEILISGTKYKAVLNDFDKSKKYYLQVVKNTDKKSDFNCEVIEFKKKSDHLEAEFNFDTYDYLAYFSISDGENIMQDLPQIKKCILNTDSSLKEFTYFDLLDNAEMETYIDIFNHSRLNYPNNIGIYLFRWKFESSNNLNNRDSLLKQISYLENNFSMNPDIHFVLAIAYSLLGNKEKIKFELNELAQSECRLFNNSFTSNIFHSVFNTGIQKKFDENEFEEILRNIMLKNPESIYTIRIISSSYKSKYDSLNIPLYYDLLKSDNYFYLDILFKVYEKIVFNFLPDSINTADRLEYEIGNYYNNKLDLYKTGKNPHFTKLPNDQIFNEIKYHKSMKMKMFNKAIRICRENIKNSFMRKNLSLINYDYLRIAKIYEENLLLLDSALSNYIQSYILKRNDKETKNELIRFYNKYTNKSNNFEDWLDSVETVVRVQSKINQSKFENSNNIIKFANGNQINLNFPNKNTVLIFYSFTCSPCKYIFNDMRNNLQNVFNSDVQFIYVSKDENAKIQLLEKEYKIGFQNILNSKEIFNEYNITGVPVIICINEDGNILNKQEGVDINWNFDDLLSIFYN